MKPLSLAKNDTKNTIRVMVLEDDQFFNRLITKKIETFVKEKLKDKKLQFDIKAYTNPIDFINNFKKDTHIVFIDYYLEADKNGIDVLKKIKSTSTVCKVIMISKSDNIKTSIISILEGASDFLIKDNDILEKILLKIEEMILKK